MILEISKYQRSAFYFDCFLSGYDREREFLFIGGSAALKIKSMLHFISAEETIENYSDYLQLLEVFFQALQNDRDIVEQRDHSMNMEQNRRLNSLIEYQCNQYVNNDNVSGYIYQLFQFRCNKLMQIEIELFSFNRFFSISLNLNSMIDFDLLSRMFSKVSSVKVVIPNEFRFTDEIIRYLYENLASYAIRNSSTFQSIEFCYSSKLVPESIRNQMASTIQHDFDNIGWIISVQNNLEDDESIYFIKVEADINPNYKPLTPALQSNIMPRQSYEPLAGYSYEYDQNSPSHYTGLGTEDIFGEIENNVSFPKGLKLRIIQQPLHYKKTHHFAACCLCCRDLTHPLSDEERVIKLTIGFIRIHSATEVPSDVYSLCIDLVGDAAGFEVGQLWSKKEQRQIAREECYENCEECYENCCQCACKNGCICDWERVCCCIPYREDLARFGTCFWCCPISSWLYDDELDWDADDPCVSQECGGCLLVGSFLCRVLFFVTYFIGKDIAALVINGMNDCNDGLMNGDSK